MGAVSPAPGSYPRRSSGRRRQYSARKARTSAPTRPAVSDAGHGDPGRPGREQRRRVSDVRAAQHGRVVPALVLEPRRGRLDHRTQARAAARSPAGRGDQHRGRDDHGERGPLLGLDRSRWSPRRTPPPSAGPRWAGRPARRRRRPRPAAPPRRPGPKQTTSTRRDPGQPVRAAAVGDPALAQVGGERRQVGQPEGGEREHHAGDPQPAAPAVQPGLVDRAEPVQHDARCTGTARPSPARGRPRRRPRRPGRAG